MVDALIAETAGFVKRTLLGEASGHDWWHIYRVRELAVRIGREENADLTVVQLAALLHDIADWKFHGGDEEVGPRVARQWLEDLHAEPAVIDHVCEIIASISFMGGGVPDRPATIEARVVQDADRLDAIGAIGIARTFAYGGARGREIFDPGRDPVVHTTPASYMANASPTINHFHEKLLLLKDRMNTECGRRIAKGRHDYMVGFLDEFHREWEGES